MWSPCHRKDAQTTTTTTTTVPTEEVPNPEALLQFGLGTSLEDAARGAESQAKAGLPPGRVGRSYGSGFESAVDGALADVERALGQERSALARAKAASESDLAVTLRGATAERANSSGTFKLHP